MSLIFVKDIHLDLLWLVNLLFADKSNWRRLITTGVVSSIPRTHLGFEQFYFQIKQSNILIIHTFSTFFIFLSMDNEMALALIVRFLVFSIICWYGLIACAPKTTWPNLESILASKRALRIKSTIHFSASSFVMFSFSAKTLYSSEKLVKQTKLTD